MNNTDTLIKRLALDVFEEEAPLTALEQCFGANGAYSAYVGGTIAPPNATDKRDVVIIESETASFAVSHLKQAVQQIGASGKADLTQNPFLSVIAISGVADGTHSIGGVISPKDTTDAYAVKHSCVDAYDNMELPADMFRFAVFVDETWADAEDVATRITSTS